jgi:prophage regulatory protein
MDNPKPSIYRLPKLCTHTGYSRSSIYKAVNAELWPPPIHLTAKSIGWPSNEVDAMIAARIRGCSDAEIRELVQQLLAARRHAGIEAA